jgi:hypothetical protein
MFTTIQMDGSLYHGSDGSSIRAMAAQGFVTPGVKANERSQGFLTPMSGRSYLTKDLGYALIYALGAAAVGQDIEWLSKRPNWEPEGGVVKVEPTGQLLPDEDWIGQVIAECEIWHRTSSWGHPTKKPDEYKLQIYNRLVPRLPYALRNRLHNKPEHKLWELATQAMLGKSINRWLLKSAQGLIPELLAQSPHMSHAGSLKVLRAWVFNKSDNQKLKPDGSNFFDVATEIPVNTAALHAARILGLI